MRNGKAVCRSLGKHREICASLWASALSNRTESLLLPVVRGQSRRKGTGSEGVRGESSWMPAGMVSPGL